MTARRPAGQVIDQLGLGRAAPKGFAEPVVRHARHVLRQGEKAHSARAHALAELTVGQPFELPDDDIELLVEELPQNLLLPRSRVMTNSSRVPTRGAPARVALVLSRSC